MEENIQRLRQEADRRYQCAVRAQRDIPTRIAEARKLELEDTCTELIQRQRTVYSIDATQAREFLDATLANLTAQARPKQRILKQTAWLPKRLHSNARILLQQRIAHLTDLTQRLEAEAKAILGSAPGQPLVGDRATSFLQLLLSVGGETRTIIRLIREAEKHRQARETQWRHSILEARQAVADQRHRCFKELASLICTLQEEISRNAAPIHSKLAQHAEQVCVESARLGKAK